jgi:hypothetical protein
MRPPCSWQARPCKRSLLNVNSIWTNRCGPHGKERLFDPRDELHSDLIKGMQLDAVSPPRRERPLAEGIAVTAIPSVDQVRRQSCLPN